MLEKTITGNNKVRCNLSYPIVAGLDADSVPQLLKVGEDGSLRANVGNFAIPEYDALSITYIGGVPVTSDALVNTVVYKKNGETVATLTIAYHGSTNNIAGVSLDLP